MTDAAKKARAAEVVIPNRLPLDSVLKGVYCRSPAERVTLLDGLTDDVATAWANRIRTGFNDFFVRRHPYVVNVSGREGQLIEVAFDRKLVSRSGEIRVRVYGTPRYGRWSGQFADGKERKIVKLRRRHSVAHVSVYMEECLAFRGRVVLDDLPF